MNNPLFWVRWGRRVAILALVTAGSYFGGSGAAQLVAHAVRVHPELPRVVNEGDAVARIDGLSAIAERNLMGAKRELGDVRRGPAVRGCHFESGSLRACSGWQVRGTVVAEAWSMAVVFDTVPKTTRLVTPGPVSPEVEVCVIRAGEVILRRGDHFERCVAEEAPRSPPAAFASRDVHRLASGDVELSREELERVRANLHEELKRVRLVPAGAGFRVLQLRPNSILSRLGLQNGDVLTHVNGLELAKPGGLGGLYNQLDRLEEAVVEFQRRGQKQALRLQIVD